MGIGEGRGLLSALDELLLRQRTWKRVIGWLTLMEILILHDLVLADVRSLGTELPFHVIHAQLLLLQLQLLHLELLQLRPFQLRLYLFQLQILQL